MQQLLDTMYVKRFCAPSVQPYFDTDKGTGSHSCNLPGVCGLYNHVACILSKGKGQ